MGASEISGYHDGYLPLLGEALRHGPWLAAAAAFALTPGTTFMIARILERRWLIPREQFTAVVYGDLLLAAATGLGVFLAGPATRPHGIASLGFGTASMALWAVFGLVQWWTEVRIGFFTSAQAVAPTKIWHQLAIYPTMGYWLWTACVGGWTGPNTPVTIIDKALMALLVLSWLATNVYDRGHPKLGHPPFDWRRCRPYPKPWPTTSQTLAAAERER